jgi:cephalosporin hydroxylase
VDGHSTSSDVHRDVCEPVRFADQRKDPVLYIVNSVYPRNHELIVLRLLLRRFVAGTWEELRTCSGELCHSYYEAAQQHGLVSNPDQETQICVQDAIDLQRPPRDIRSLLS